MHQADIENFARQEIIFHAALQLTSGEARSTYLGLACGSDSELRRRVEALLESETDGVALTPPAIPSGALLHSVAPQGPDDITGDLPLQRIGRYRLLEKIGEGGCGTVYLAEQEQPLRLRVALKIVKAGMDSKAVIGRFEAERQALALMDHPNIAKVFDAGSMETGRPYFVLELVSGVKITDYCVQQNLPIRDRLDLFLKVCDAVQHAHQKGIIHRDLKPSNILVSSPGPDPTLMPSVRNSALPKVIDFGIAKAIDGKLTDATNHTGVHQFLGTPAYMSPEQADLSPDIDTRTDIYSLGVLLYELLTGKPPFDNHELLTAGLDEMRRIIREKEPLRPSHTLRLNPNPETLPSDLDWIVMKCLEKDRSRRYETANALAGDIQLYLADEPVLARPPSTVYRLRKFVDRHRLQFGAAIFAVLSLIAAVVVSGWQAARATRSESNAMEQARLAKIQAELAASETRRADREAALAREQAAAAEAVKQFLVDNLLGVNPLLATPDPDAQSFEVTKSLLEKTARSIEGRFTNQPLVEADLRQALYHGFTALRNHPQALFQAERIVEIHQGLIASPRTNILAAICGLARSKALLGHSQEALELLDPIMGEGRNTPGAEFVQLNYGFVLLVSGRPGDAVPHLREGAARRKETLGEKHLWFKQDVGRLAQALEESGNLSEAEEIWRQNFESSVKDHGPEHPLTANLEWGLGRCLVKQRKADSALPILRRVVEFSTRTTGTHGYWTLDAEFWLGQALEQIGGVEETAQLYRNLSPRVARYLPLVPSGARFLNQAITDFFVRHRLFADAKSAAEPLQSWLEANPPQDGAAFENLIRVTAAAKGWPAAADLCRKHIDLFADSMRPSLSKAWIFRFVGDDEQYRRVVVAVLNSEHSPSTNDLHIPLEIASLGPVHFTPSQIADIDARIKQLELVQPDRGRNEQVWGYRAIAQMHLRLHRPDKALPALEQALARQNPPDAYTLYLKAACLHQLGRHSDARQAFSDAQARSKEQLNPDTPESFMNIQDLYQHLVMRRETSALSNRADGGTPR